MSLRTAAVAAIFLFSLRGWASQSMWPIETPDINLDSSGLAISGVANTDQGEQKVSGLVHSLIVIGEYGACTPAANCTAPKFYKVGKRRLVARIEIDRDSDGNIDTVKYLNVGSVGQQNHIHFNVPLKVFYVVETYTLAEKLAGAQDRTFISGTISLR